MSSMAPPSRNGKKASSLSSVILLVFGALGMVCCLGAGAAALLPGYQGMPKRAAQSEAKVTLKGAYTAQRAYMAERDTFSEYLEEVGLIPEPKNRYRLFFSLKGEALVPGTPTSLSGRHTGMLADETRKPRPDNAQLKAGLPVEVAGELGLKGECPKACRITMAAVANLDDDDTLDVWSISTEDRVIGGMPVKAGEPYNHVNDLER